MPSRKKSGLLTQALAAAGNSRAYRPDRGIHECRGFGVIHALQSDEQNYRALLLRQFGETALQVAKFEPRRLIGRVDPTRAGCLRLEMVALSRISAHVADVSAIQN